MQFSLPSSYLIPSPIASSCCLYIPKLPLCPPRGTAPQIQFHSVPKSVKYICFFMERLTVAEHRTAGKPPWRRCILHQVSFIYSIMSRPITKVAYHRLTVDSGATYVRLHCTVPTWSYSTDTCEPSWNNAMDYQVTNVDRSRFTWPQWSSLTISYIHPWPNTVVALVWGSYWCFNSQSNGFIIWPSDLRCLLSRTLQLLAVSCVSETYWYLTGGKPWYTQPSAKTVCPHNLI